MLIQILPCDVSSIFHILTIIKNVLQILLCGMSKTFENCLRSLKHFLRSHYSIGNSNVSVLVLIDSICLKSMELFLENQGSVSAAEHRSLKHTVGANPARKGPASHRNSALEGIGQPVSLSVGGGASRPKAIAEGVEPRNTQWGSRWF